MRRAFICGALAFTLTSCVHNAATRTPIVPSVLDPEFSWPAAFRNPVEAYFNIEDGSNSLRSDGRGWYAHRDESVIALIGDAASLWTWRGTTTGDNSARTDANSTFPKRRYLEIDLSHPLVASGARNLGVVRDSIGSIHMFFKEDSAAKQILGLWQVPLSQTMPDDRVEFLVKTGGHQYLLQFGPWGMGKYSPRGKISGNGTVPATVTRTDSTRWVVRSGPESIGRLWNVDDIQNPGDCGQYKFRFAFIVTAARGTPP